jgi:electron transfer flavoprotein beta subunit
MRIVVLVKYVPEPTAQWRFTGDLTVDREAVEGRLSELDEHAVEQAVRLVEGGLDAQVTFLTVGPARATEGLRKALAMGGDAAVHVLDPAIHGSDALGTSLVLAEAVRRLEPDLVLCGMASTDAEMSVMPAMVAERLGAGLASFASALSVDPQAGTVTIRRNGDRATEEVVAHLPAVVSVTDQAGEARYPAFRAIMAAKKKPLTTWTLADLGVSPTDVGPAAGGTVVRQAAPAPERQSGTVLVDEGDAAVQVAEFLTTRGFL